MHNGDKTCCKRGHEYTVSNTYRQKNTGARRCRKCESIRLTGRQEALFARERTRIVKWLRRHRFYEASIRIQDCEHLTSRRLGVAS